MIPAKKISVRLSLKAVCILLLLVGCKGEQKNVASLNDSTVVNSSENDQTAEKYRPNFHFTPAKNWMNDPNGMFYLNGTYHLFYQHFPEGNTWGPMHWGHATSKDLIIWEHQPIALAPDEKGYIFSGSAVVDVNNTSGFGDGKTQPVIAMFTYHDAKAEKEGKKDYQSQAIAYSLDEGQTWTKYAENPVIKNPDIKDFRDPKMQWDEERNQWVMVLAAQNKALFYTSKNLKEWQLVSELGEELGAHGGVWECPDFFPIQVEGTSEIKWVLLQSLNPGGYNGGSGTQYFVGDFDGKQFKIDASMKKIGKDHSYWVDYGKDNYAGVTWSNIPEEDGRKLFIGWMSNWQYAEKVPTETWRSAMTLPRELTLKKVENTYRLFSEPVRELQKYYGATNFTLEKEALKNGESLFDTNQVDLSKVHLSFTLPSADKDFTFALTSKVGDSLYFGYKAAEKEFFIDRKKSGIIDFNENFADKESVAPRISTAAEIHVELILDKTSIEAFYDNGETVMTEIFFPQEPYQDFIYTGSAEKFEIKNLTVEQLEFK